MTFGIVLQHSPYDLWRVKNALGPLVTFPTRGCLGDSVWCWNAPSVLRPMRLVMLSLLSSLIPRHLREAWKLLKKPTNGMSDLNVVRRVMVERLTILRMEFLVSTVKFARWYVTMLSRLLKTYSERSVMACVDMRNIDGSSLLVTPHTPGTTSSKFREVANAEARVFVRSELRIVFVVFVLSRTLRINMALLKRPPCFRVVYLLMRLVTGDDGATGQTVVMLSNTHVTRLV